MPPRRIHPRHQRGLIDVKPGVHSRESIVLGLRYWEFLIQQPHLRADDQGCEIVVQILASPLQNPLPNPK